MPKQTNTEQKSTAPTRYSTIYNVSISNILAIFAAFLFAGVGLALALTGFALPLAFVALSVAVKVTVGLFAGLALGAIFGKSIGVLLEKLIMPAFLSQAEENKRDLKMGKGEDTQEALIPKIERLMKEMNWFDVPLQVKERVAQLKTGEDIEYTNALNADLERISCHVGPMTEKDFYSKAVRESCNRSLYTDSANQRMQKNAVMNKAHQVLEEAGFSSPAHRYFIASAMSQSQDGADEYGLSFNVAGALEYFILPELADVANVPNFCSSGDDAQFYTIAKDTKSDDAMIRLVRSVKPVGLTDTQGNKLDETLLNYELVFRISADADKGEIVALRINVLKGERKETQQMSQKIQKGLSPYRQKLEDVRPGFVASFVAGDATALRFPKAKELSPSSSSDDLSADLATPPDSITPRITTDYDTVSSHSDSASSSDDEAAVSEGEASNLNDNKPS